MKKILIVEDEEITSIALETYLVSIGFIVTDCVNCANQAHDSIQRQKPDLVITDVMLIGQKTGTELARELYQKYQLPIVFLTAFCDDEILELAKQSNPVGYILKPYKEDELKAILTLALHRLESKVSQKCTTIVSIDKYLYDEQKKTLSLDNQPISLGVRSEILLEVLLKNRNQVVTYETLIFAIWGDSDYNNLDRLRHLVGRLKQKLDLNSIYSIKNIGYVFREELKT